MAEGNSIEIWATGKLVEGETVESVMDKVQKRFPTASAAQRARFISGRPFRVTTVNSEEMAKVGIAAMAQMGVVTEARPAVVPDFELSEVPPAPAPPASPPPTPSVSASRTPPTSIPGVFRSVPDASPAPVTPDTPTPADDRSPGKPSRWDWFGVGSALDDPKQRRNRWTVTGVIGVLGFANPLLFGAAYLLNPRRWPTLKLQYQKIVIVMTGILIVTLPLPKGVVHAPSTRDEAGQLILTPECQQNRQCILETLAREAEVPCIMAIERRAKHEARWTDRAGLQKFPYQRWSDPDPKVATYAGNQVEFQNGFNVWGKVSYECDFDTEKRRVRTVRVYG